MSQTRAPILGMQTRIRADHGCRPLVRRHSRFSRMTHHEMAGPDVAGGTRERRFVALGAGLLGNLYLAGIGLVIASVPALWLISTGRPRVALACLCAGLLVGIIALPVLVAPRILPVGVPLSRAIAQGLHGQMEMMRRRLDAPRIDGIVLDHGFEIRMVCGARSVLSPRTSRQLIIGLPLMHALSAVEFRALMAREIATTSRKHGRIALGIATLHEHWQRLLAGAGASPFLRMTGFHRFLGRYSPWYAKQACGVLRRLDREADSMGARISRPGDLASAIVRVGLAVRFVEERVLPELRAQIRRFGEPPTGAHARFEQALQGAFDDPRFDRWLVDVMRSRPKAGSERRQPGERLDALGFGMKRTDAFGRLLKAAFSARGKADAAASHYLGPNASYVTVSLEKSWMDQVRETAHTESARRAPRVLPRRTVTTARASAPVEQARSA